MHRLLSTRLDKKAFAFIDHNRVLFFIIFSLSTGLLCYHTFLLVARYLKYEIQQTITVVREESHPMPIVKLQLDSFRQNVNVSAKVPVKLDVLQLLLDRKEIPSWAYIHSFGRQPPLNQFYVDVNRIDRSYFVDNNASIGDLQATVFLRMILRMILRNLLHSTCNPQAFLFITLKQN